MSARSLADVAPAEGHEVYVYPGQLATAHEPTMITTILGTCVSVCLVDAVTGIGGLNHFMLPESFPTGSAPGRFGDRATFDLVDALIARGASARRLQAKVFGGMGSRLEGPAFARDLGERNIEMAFGILRQLAIPVLTHDVGGTRSRKVRFFTTDGRAWVRHF